MLAFVAAALIAQDSSFARTKDLLFAQAQEDFIYATRTVHDLDQVLDGKHARLIRRLGCERFECRDDAAAELASEGDRAARAILWGRRMRDPEIRDRCGKLWDRLFRCPKCQGSGAIEETSVQGWSFGPIDCNGCDATGDLRYERRWVDGEYVLVDRTLP